MLPFEFVVVGTPISQQAKSSTKAGWRATVAAAARAEWPGGTLPLTSPLKMTIVYYYDGVALDTDNMIKPIQDALVGVVYQDDAQLTDVTACKRDLNGSYRVRGLSPQLAKGFSSDRDFVHIRLEAPQDPQELI